MLEQIFFHPDLSFWENVGCLVFAVIVAIAYVTKD